MKNFWGISYLSVIDGFGDWQYLSVAGIPAPELRLRGLFHLCQSQGSR